MQNRREFLERLALAAAALPFTARAALPALPPQEFFIVNGWVLTRADLAALKLDAL